MVIFGDWGYGPEDNRYGVAADTRAVDETLMYGDPRLEEQLWGDDDVILIGYGDDNYGAEVSVWAGDGNDLVDIHGDWRKYSIYGGRGNDTFNVDGGASVGKDYGMFLNGGLGNDIF